MRKLLIGLVLSVMATAASAQWMLVTEASSGDKFYADPSTKRRTGNIVRIWMLQDYPKPELVLGQAYHSDKMYRQYDCAERTSQSLQNTSFVGRMGSGQSLGTSTQPTNKTYVAPGSVANTLLNFACK